MIDKIKASYLGEDDYGEHQFELRLGDVVKKFGCHTEQQYSAEVLSLLMSAFHPKDSPFCHKISLYKPDKRRGS